jgi:hypothetical protein
VLGAYVAQALLTKRKGNKKFGVFDLKLQIAWEGLWNIEDAGNPTKVRRYKTATSCPSMQMS